MAHLTQGLQRIFGRKTTAAEAKPDAAAGPATPQLSRVNVDIAPNDPLVAYVQSANTAVDLTRLQLDSPALRQLRGQGVTLVAPLINQGEFLGLVNIGARRSEQEFTSDDRALMNTLTAQASPALRIAQLVEQQRLEAQMRERLEQELRVANLVQRTLLPQDVPALDGWSITRYYQPAREVGGDIYDFLMLPDGRLGLVIGDVTDKGVPAALVMASTRSYLNAIAMQGASPGRVLEYVNAKLVPSIPERMFVTCLYAVLDLHSGHVQYANAGHDLPFLRNKGGAHELRATGMPLGLMDDMPYEEKEAWLEPGDMLLLYSDGLVEAHNPAREMFGFPRLSQLVSQHPSDDALIDGLLRARDTFTGPGWEREDDTTLVAVRRNDAPAFHEDRALKAESWPRIAEFNIPSAPGNERLAMRQVAEAVRDLLPPDRIEKLKTAVAEAAMNGIEHGNRNDPDVPVRLIVFKTAGALAVHVIDKGGGRAVPEPVVPDLDAKLEGLQTPRGWGLFLIQNMVDEMNTLSEPVHHTVELIMRLG